MLNPALVNKAHRFLEEDLPRYANDDDWSHVRARYEEFCYRESIPSAEKEHAWAGSLRNFKFEGEQSDPDSKKYRSWDEIDALKFPDNMWRIKSFLAKKSVTFIAGQSGDRKTWLAFDLIDSLTKPRNFLHADRFSVEGCSVLYIDPEMGEYMVQRRGRQLGFSDERKHKIVVYSDAINLNSEDGGDLNSIIQLIEKEHIGVVIVDTFRGAAGGMKEEKAEEIRMFFEKLRPLKELGVSLVFLDHMRKPSHFEGKTPKKEQMFASMDKIAISDNVVLIRTEIGSEVTSVYQRKNRLAPELAPFKFRMEDSDINDEKNNKTKLIYDGEVDSNESKVEEAQEVILEALEDGPMTRKQLIGVVYKEKKIAERTASEACRVLEASGYIEATKRGRENLYTLKPPKTGDVATMNVGKNDSDNNSATTLPINNLTA